MKNKVVNKENRNHNRPASSSAVRNSNSGFVQGPERAGGYNTVVSRGKWGAGKYTGT